jgi:DNA-binding transcriptional MerR regulator
MLVDQQSDYRRYDVEQIPTARVIRRFQNPNKPLNDVRAVLAVPTKLGAHHVDAKAGPGRGPEPPPRPICARYGMRRDHSLSYSAATSSIDSSTSDMSMYIARNAFGMRTKPNFS